MWLGRGCLLGLPGQSRSLPGCFDLYSSCVSFLGLEATRRPRWRIEVRKPGEGLKVEGYQVIKLTRDPFRLLEVWASLCGRRLNV